MIRAVKYLIYAAILLCLVVIALANTDAVVLRVLPEELAEVAGWSFATPPVPLFLVIFASMAVGFLLGDLFEWLREHKFRVEARTERKERQRLEQEVGRMRASERGGDDVLALVEASENRR